MWWHEQHLLSNNVVKDGQNYEDFLHISCSILRLSVQCERQIDEMRMMYVMVHLEKRKIYLLGN